MSPRFSFQSAALICLVLAAPAFAVDRLGDALAGFDDYQGETPAAVRPTQSAGTKTSTPAPVAFEASADVEVAVTATGRPA
ncbi:MAG TPA: hypothetical protein VF576_09650 [Rubricoccaceae bacterium]|jgi:hypothetical protein